MATKATGLITSDMVPNARSPQTLAATCVNAFARSPVKRPLLIITAWRSPGGRSERTACDVDRYASSSARCALAHHVGGEHRRGVRRGEGEHDPHQDQHERDRDRRGAREGATGDLDRLRAADQRLGDQGHQDQDTRLGEAPHERARSHRGESQPAVGGQERRQQVPAARLGRDGLATLAPFAPGTHPEQGIGGGAPTSTSAAVDRVGRCRRGGTTDAGHRPVARRTAGGPARALGHPASAPCARDARRQRPGGLRAPGRAAGALVRAGRRPPGPAVVPRGSCAAGSRRCGSPSTTANAPRWSTPPRCCDATVCRRRSSCARGWSTARVAPWWEVVWRASAAGRPVVLDGAELRGQAAVTALKGVPDPVRARGGRRTWPPRSATMRRNR